MIELAGMWGHKDKPLDRPARSTKRSHFGSRSKRHAQRIGIQLVGRVQAARPAEA
ncbi:hypothetical protein RBSWK_05087 [Rhodopirellula baltica SWK14]|uniref:Uncharacterized protein n=1 Tax=Rhodopirellula baltica SWK14 TaxID=993516 RepID=L7CA03_RHOBT|nr:hypothetical protein RBSWK_05087 [Rhodopirellula baltica SWK14]